MLHWGIVYLIPIYYYYLCNANFVNSVSVLLQVPVRALVSPVASPSVAESTVCIQMPPDLLPAISKFQEALSLHKRQRAVDRFLQLLVR